MTPVCQVLIVSLDQDWANQINARLSRIQHQCSSSYELVFSCLSWQHPAFQQRLEAMLDLHIVLLDMQDLDQHGAKLPQIQRSHGQLAYGLIWESKQARGVAPAGLTVLGQYYRDSPDFALCYQHICQHLHEKSATPFFDALKQYVTAKNDAWHTPGHIGGASLKDSAWASDFYTFFGQTLFQADLSVSVQALDSLLHPIGVIEQAQILAAKAFGAKQTYFVTNGSSTSNKIILQSLLSPGDKILLDRNCHKSVHHGVVMSGANPVYLSATLNRQYGLFGPVAKQTLFENIEKHADAKVLILTSSTYDGLRYDLRPIIEHAHAHGLKVVVDEAWFGFAQFHPHFLPTALACGADYVTQSTHKVLSALSQAGMVHVNDPDFDAHRFRENFNMYASTSPHYSLIASLDVARKQAVMEGHRLLQQTLALAQDLRDAIDKTGMFKVLERQELMAVSLQEDNIQLDETKLTIDVSQSPYTALQLQQLLATQYHIQIEKHTFNTITLLVTIGTSFEQAERFIQALNQISQQANGNVPYPLEQASPVLPELTDMLCLPRDAFYAKGEMHNLFHATDGVNVSLVGKIACDQIVPYPPGVPILVPGQVIDQTILNYLMALRNSNNVIEIHGVFEQDDVVFIRVLSEKEYALLRKKENEA